MVAVSGNRDFYKILGISKDVGDSDLKKAYMKMARKYHPDKGGDEKIFKDVAEAYAVLSDKDKRKVYDLLGEEGLKANLSPEEAEKYQRFGGFGGSNGNATNGFTTFSTGSGGGFEMPPGFAEDLFSQFFRNGQSNGIFRDGSNVNMDPSFQSFNKDRSGGSTRNQFAFNMNDNASFFKRPEQKATLKKRPLSRSQPFEVALEDLVEGVKKKLKITRKVKNPQTGNVTQEVKIVCLPVKAGMKSGAKFTFKGLGNDLDPLTAEPEDMVFVLNLKKNDTFTREGNDLVITVPISLKQALQGGTTTINTIDKRQIRIPFGKLSSSDATTIVPEQGLPDPKNGKRGALVVKFKIDLMKISDDKKKSITSIL